MTIDRKELRRLCEAATPGPWEWWGDGLLDSVERGPVLEVGDDGKAYGLHSAVLVHNWDESAKAANKALIAAARTALPALLDALEEQEAMTSALNGDVTELGQKLEAAEAREKNLLAAVKNIAKQRLHAEIADCDPDELDWLSGYEGCVKEARAAIAETAP